MKTSVATAKPAKKYRKVGNLPNGEWEIEEISTGEKKPASQFKNATKENIEVS